MGNPPYSGISANINEWTEKLLKTDIDGAQSYYKLDSKPLGEKKVWLQDDYVKFLRFAQWKIQKAGKGIVAMITNNGYLDNPTFRGMRQSLMKTFNEIYILDLHGNSLKKETTPDGGKDENVFDIRQGVTITIFVLDRLSNTNEIYHYDLYGLRGEKYLWLDKNEFNESLYKKFTPSSPWYFFIPRKTAEIQRYLKWKQITEIFPVNNVGIVTARDKFVIDFDLDDLMFRIIQFRNLNLNCEIFREAYGLKDTSTFKLSRFRKELAKDENWQEYYETITYRPFDIRHIYYSKWIVERPGYEVLRHMLEENIGLISPRQFKEEPGAFITNNLIGHKTVSAYDINYLFPLYLYPDLKNPDLFSQHKNEKEPNIPKSLFQNLSIAYSCNSTPEDILYYIYSVLYSNIYRENYLEFLKIDFPRIPFTSNYDIFKKMTALGQRLIDLHLLKSSELAQPTAKFQGQGEETVIGRPKYDESEYRVYINKDYYFEGVTRDVWEYQIGGYQVMDKYLKDRKGRRMDDPRHYIHIATALEKTIEIQEEIDAIYPEVEKDVIKFN